MNCLVVGAGISGLSAAKLLKKEKRTVFIVDEKLVDSKKSSLENFELVNDLPLFLSRNPLEKAVISPGISKDHYYIKVLEQFKIPMISEIDLALPYFTSKIIGVTGTNGKSSICAMIHHILKKNGQKSLIGGNFGIPLTELAVEGKNPDYLIIELSSYQLEWSEHIKPYISIISNLTHDHLVRHKTMENYLKCKLKLTQYNDKNSFTLIDQSVTTSIKNFGFSLPQGKITIVDPEKMGDIFDREFIQKGHHVSNALFSVLTIEKILSLSPKILINDLLDYEKLPYRCEVIYNQKNRLIINDSKSTNVASSIEALKNIENTCILLLGGIHKDESFKPISKFKNKIKCILSFGASRDYIAQEIGSDIKVIPFKTLKDTLAFIKEKKDYFSSFDILFSPGGASQDEFSNFEERGSFFTEQINSIFNSDFYEKR